MPIKKMCAMEYLAVGLDLGGKFSLITLDELPVCNLFFNKNSFPKQDLDLQKGFSKLSSPWVLEIGAKVWPG